MFVEELDEAFARTLEHDWFDDVDLGEWVVELARDCGLSTEDIELTRRSFIQGETPSNIATDMGLAEKTVRNRLTAVKRALLFEVKSNDE